MALRELRIWPPPRVPATSSPVRLRVRGELRRVFERSLDRAQAWARLLCVHGSWPIVRT